MPQILAIIVFKDSQAIIATALATFVIGDLDRKSGKSNQSFEAKTICFTRSGFVNNYPLFMENREAGNFSIKQWKIMGTDCIQLNQTVEDSGLQVLFRNPDFRAGLSVAINRQEINSTIYDNWGTPMQAAIDPGLPNFSKSWMTKWASYSPSEAASYFDRAGLKWDSSGKFRLHPMAVS